MKTVGGSIFVRNAIKYDYCIREAVASLLPLCDQIVVMDCQSDDGTTEMLRQFCAAANATPNPRIEYHEGILWECAENYDRLRIIANQAINKLHTDWHFMLQADEVLHESSLQVIRHIAETAPDNVHTALVRRIHVWGDHDHYLRHDLPTERKPAGDAIVRLGRRGTQAHGDAEGLVMGNCMDAVNHITIFHYGFVRKNEVQKVLDMQSWFHGKGGTPDQRVVEMANRDGVFRPDVFFKYEELGTLYMSHPAVAKRWVDERRSLYPPIGSETWGASP